VAEAMNKSKILFITLVCGLLMGFTNKHDVQIEKAKKSTRVASIDEDGVITLEVVSKSNGRIAHGYFTYPIGHKQYEALKKEIGTLKVGEWQEIKPLVKERRDAIEVHLISSSRHDSQR